MEELSEEMMDLDLRVMSLLSYITETSNRDDQTLYDVVRNAYVAGYQDATQELIPIVQRHLERVTELARVRR